MTEKRFTWNSKEVVIDDNVTGNQLEVIDITEIDMLLGVMNELHEENVELKNSLKEFEVFESDRINGAVVTNDDFSVTLHGNNEAYMVCNMLNRFIRGVKNRR